MCYPQRREAAGLSRLQRGLGPEPPLITLPLRSSLRPFFIRIIKIECVLVSVCFAQSIAQSFLYWRDPCNFATHIECTTLVVRNRLGWIGVAAVFGLLLAHAASIGFGVYAMKKRAQTEPVRLLLRDTLLVIFGMPLATLVFCLGMRPAVRPALDAIDGGVTFVENIYR